jgi:spermidine synthase
LVIGYGSGRQLSTLVSLPDLQRIDVVEINRLNFAASDYFYVDTETVLGDPRVTVHVDDGRNHLLRSRRSYDVILVDVGGIEGDGAEFFYTREFLELSREHLEPGGLVFTWMHINRMLGPRGWMYQRTFREVFPETSIWLGTGEPTSYGWLWLVGSDADLSIDFAEVERRWGRLTPGQLRELELAGLREASALLSLHLVSLEDTLPERIAKARVLTDQHPYYKPIWESPHQSRAFFERADVYDASVKHLLASEPGPPLVNLSRDRQEAVEDQRRRLRTMARNGIARGAFRLFREPMK